MIGAPAIDFEVYDHRLQDDPWPVYRRLRDEAPLFHQECRRVYSANVRGFASVPMRVTPR